MVFEANYSYWNETGEQNAHGTAEKLAVYEEQLTSTNRKKVDEEVVEYLDYVN